MLLSVSAPPLAVCRHSVPFRGSLSRVWRRVSPVRRLQPVLASSSAPHSRAHSLPRSRVCRMRVGPSVLSPLSVTSLCLPPSPVSTPRPVFVTLRFPRTPSRAAPLRLTCSPLAPLSHRRRCTYLRTAPHCTALHCTAPHRNGAAAARSSASLRRSGVSSVSCVCVIRPFRSEALF